MKTIGIISLCNIYVLPYAKTYVNAIIENENHCDLIYWDRDAVDGKNDGLNDCTKHSFQYKLTERSSRIDKLLGYIKATNYIKDTIKENNYDGLIFLQTHAAVFCNSILQEKYKGKYIIDIRDYTLENIKIFYNTECKAIASAYSTVISSPAYKNFLPNGDFVVAHNYTPFLSEKVEEIRGNRKHDGPINISFIGTIRFLEMDKKILRRFANDTRFSINYFGRGAEILENFCEENNISNVKFHGSFIPEQTLEFYKQTDMINNLYGNHNRFLDDALSNKLYHSGQLHIPILVCPETYMEEVSIKYHMGFVFDVENINDPNKLFNWYNSLDFAKLDKGCDEFIQRVVKDNEMFYQMCKKFCK